MVENVLLIVSRTGGSEDWGQLTEVVLEDDPRQEANFERGRSAKNI